MAKEKNKNKDIEIDGFVIIIITAMIVLGVMGIFFFMANASCDGCMNIFFK